MNKGAFTVSGRYQATSHSLPIGFIYLKCVLNFLNYFSGSCGEGSKLAQSKTCYYSLQNRSQRQRKRML